MWLTFNHGGGGAKKNKKVDPLRKSYTVTLSLPLGLDEHIIQWSTEKIELHIISNVDDHSLFFLQIRYTQCQGCFHAEKGNC